MTEISADCMRPTGVTEHASSSNVTTNVSQISERGSKSKVGGTVPSKPKHTRDRHARAKGSFELGFEEVMPSVNWVYPEKNLKRLGENPKHASGQHP